MKTARHFFLINAFLLATFTLTIWTSPTTSAQQSKPFYQFEPNSRLVYEIHADVSVVDDARKKTSGGGALTVQLGSPLSTIRNSKGMLLPSHQEGTGVWLDKQHLLTTAGLASNKGNIQIVLPKGRTIRASVLNTGVNSPFGILKTNEPINDVVPIAFDAAWQQQLIKEKSGVAILTGDGLGQIAEYRIRSASSGGFSYRNGKLQINQFCTIQAVLPAHATGSPALTSEGKVHGLIASPNVRAGTDRWTIRYGYALRKFVQDNGFEFRVADDDWPTEDSLIAKRIAASCAKVLVTRPASGDARTPIQLSGNAFRNFRGPAELRGALGPISCIGTSCIKRDGTFDVANQTEGSPSRMLRGEPATRNGLRDDQLPFLLGPVSAFLFEKVPADKKSWQTETTEKIRVIDRGRFGYSFQMSGFRDRTIMTLDATTTHNYLLDRSGNLICQIEIKTNDDSDNPRYHLKGQKRIRIDQQTGMPGSVIFDGTFTQNLDTESFSVMVSLSFQHLTGKALESHVAQKSVARNARSSSAKSKNKSTVKEPTTASRDDKWQTQYQNNFEIVKSGRHPFSGHAGLRRMDPLGGDTELVKFILENRHDRRYYSGFAFDIVRDWATSDNKLLIEEVLADPDLGHFDRKKLLEAADRIGANSSIEPPLTGDPRKDRIAQMRRRTMNRAGSPENRNMEGRHPENKNSEKKTIPGSNQLTRTDLIDLLSQGTDDDLPGLRSKLNDEQDGVDKALTEAVIEQIEWLQKLKQQ